MLRNNVDTDYFNRLSKGHFPGLLGIEVTHLSEGELHGEIQIKPEFFAPNGFLHAGSIVTFADTLAGYATVAHLPEKGKSFTTLELKSNFIGAAKQGTLKGICKTEHTGKTTQIWRVEVSEMETSKKIALFSCTQLILY